MIKINIAAVGKLKENYWTDAVNEYAKRISRFASFNIYELPEAPDNGDALSQNEVEGVGILKKARGFCILLDLIGDPISSEELARTIDERAAHGVSEFTFIIGGSRGVSNSVRNRAEMIVSFGRVTYPHQLMRVIVAEQIYRALTIIHNTGYHK